MNPEHKAALLACEGRRPVTDIVVVLRAPDLHRPCNGAPLALETEIPHVSGLQLHEGFDPGLFVMPAEPQRQTHRLPLQQKTVRQRSLRRAQHLYGIGPDTGVDLGVATNRDVKRIVRIGPYVEVRGVVAARIDAVIQHLGASQGADAQERRVRRGVRGALVPLVGDRGNLALQVRKHVERPRQGLRRRADDFSRRIFRSSPAGVEDLRPGRKVHGLDAVQADVSGIRCDRDVVGDLRHDALYLDGRKHYRFIGRGNRHLAFISHRQHIVVVGVRNGEILPCRAIARVTAHIGCNAQQVIARQALEAQRRGTLVTVLDDIAVGVEKVEVQVAERLFVRSAGHGRHRVGTYGHAD